LGGPIKKPCARSSLQEEEYGWVVRLVTLFGIIRSLGSPILSLEAAKNKIISSGGFMFIDLTGNISTGYL
jgi:hypothetical protein